jgi:hypothetical protein
VIPSAGVRVPMECPTPPASRRPRGGSMRFGSALRVVPDRPAGGEVRGTGRWTITCTCEGLDPAWLRVGSRGRGGVPLGQDRVRSRVPRQDVGAIGLGRHGWAGRGSAPGNGHPVGWGPPTTRHGRRRGPLFLSCLVGERRCRSGRRAVLGDGGVDLRRPLARHAVRTIAARPDHQSGDRHCGPSGAGWHAIAADPASRTDPPVGVRDAPRAQTLTGNGLASARRLPRDRDRG